MREGVSFFFLFFARPATDVDAHNISAHSLHARTNYFYEESITKNIALLNFEINLEIYEHPC